MYDVHINRIPYAGNLSYRALPAIETYNWPMLGVETALLEEAGPWAHHSRYLHNNQRVLNRVWGPRGAMNRREKSFARICRDLLTLVGIVWLAAAVFELLTATIGY